MRLTCGFVQVRHDITSAKCKHLLLFQRDEEPQLWRKYAGQAKCGWVLVPEVKK
jgi:hypothetical protein